MTVYNSIFDFYHYNLKDTFGSAGIRRQPFRHNSASRDSDERTSSEQFNFYLASKDLRTNPAAAEQIAANFFESLSNQTRFDFVWEQLSQHLFGLVFLHLLQNHEFVNQDAILSYLNAARFGGKLPDELANSSSPIVRFKWELSFASLSPATLISISCTLACRLAAYSASQPDFDPVDADFG